MRSGFAARLRLTFKAENIGGARSRGVEVELRGGVTEHFILQSEATWTQAIDKATGNQLPVQPEWVAFAQPEAHSGTLSKWVSDIMAFFQVSYVGKTYDDPRTSSRFARAPCSRRAVVWICSRAAWD